MSGRAKTAPQSDKAGRRLLAAGFLLLIAGLIMGALGPRLTGNGMPPDIGNPLGEMDWLRLGWTIAGMIVGALGLMCLVAKWALRPGRSGKASGAERARPE